MTTTGISQRAIAALAALVHEARPDWDEPGIAAAIRRCPAVGIRDLMIAFARAASDPTNETPAAVTFLDNRAWDSDGFLPCKVHPNAGRRTDGECGGCHADRMEARTSPPTREATPPPAPLREMFAAHTKRDEQPDDADRREAERERMAEARLELETFRQKSEA